MGDLYALDFDGVLCDSCGESSLSAVKVNFNLSRYSLSSRFAFEKLLDFVSLILILIFENWNFRYCPVLLEHPLIVPCLYRLPK